MLMGLLYGALEARHDPTIRKTKIVSLPQRILLGLMEDDAFLFGVHQYIARGVPNFIAEVSITFHSIQVELDVAPRGGEGIESKTQCVCAIGSNAIGEGGARIFGDLLLQLWLHQVASAFSD